MYWIYKKSGSCRKKVHGILQARMNKCEASMKIFESWLIGEILKTDTGRILKSFLVDHEWVPSVPVACRWINRHGCPCPSGLQFAGGGSSLWGLSRIKTTQICWWLRGHLAPARENNFAKDTYDRALLMHTSDSILGLEEVPSSISQTYWPVQTRQTVLDPLI